jgi:hypothetical protein
LKTPAPTTRNSSRAVPKVARFVIVTSSGD